MKVKIICILVMTLLIVIPVLPVSGTIDIIIMQINDPHIAYDDYYIVDEDTTLIKEAPGVLDNDYDPEGEELEAYLASEPSNGDLILNLDGSFTYNPNENFYGLDSFTYKAYDGYSSSNIATVNITVNPINDPPTSEDIEVKTYENTPYVFHSTDFPFYDVDEGDTLQGIKTVKLPDKGNLTLYGVDVEVDQEIHVHDIDAGEFRFTPRPNETGEPYTNLSIRVSDGASWSDSSYIVTISVGPFANSAPNIDFYNGPIRGKVGINYQYNIQATDPDGDDVWYYVDWDDGTYDDWFGPFLSGETIIVNHTWVKQGIYRTKAKARDIHGAESDWEELVVTIPKNKPINNPFLNHLQTHPNLFPILQRLLHLL